MKNAIWIGRRQVRGLVILLALLPLIPTALLIHTMWEQSEEDRGRAISEMNEMYRYQLRHAAERFSLAPSDTPRGDGDLVRFLTHVFGDTLPMRIARPDGAILYVSESQVSETGFGYQIAGGDFRDFVVTLDSANAVPIHVLEEQQATIRHAAYALLGTILMAGGVWFAVNRGLRVDESRKDLITTISHEIKTPVSAIKILTESLETGELDGAKREEYLGLIARENERIEHLANRFLTYGRLEKGQLSMDAREVSLGPFFADLESRMAPKFASRDGALTMECGGDVRVTADRNALEILFMNLVENALKYGGSPPRAAVVARNAEDWVEIRVRDNGRGIPKAERNAVFRRFYRSEGRLDDGQTGVGLGLAICRRLSRLMRGRLTLSDSRDPDFGGAEFTLLLPVAGEGRPVKVGGGV